MDIAENVTKFTQYNRLIYISFPQMTILCIKSSSYSLSMIATVDWKTGTRETETDAW